MLFAELDQKLSKGPVGLGSMRDFERQCMAAVRSDPANAALYRLLAAAAAQFIDTFDDGPLDVSVAAKAREGAIRLTRIASEAAQAPADAKVAALNEIAQTVLG